MKTELDKAILVACKQLPFKSERQTENMLEFAADSMVDAYRMGAEEAQSEIIGRLTRLREIPRGAYRHKPSKPSPTQRELDRLKALAEKVRRDVLRGKP